MKALPPSWDAVLGAQLQEPYFRSLAAFVAEARRSGQVFPPEDDVFAAFRLTPYDRVKVLLLGQDPYHDDGQAHGLCFSVKPPTAPPPSLRNVFRELHTDLGVPVPAHGDLTAWAGQGVLLLNSILTVAAHRPASHRNQGWETFTDAAISALNTRPTPLVFCLWGAWAKKKAPLVDRTRHVVIEGAHPSPLSAKGFFGSRPFSRINEALVSLGHGPVDWRL